MSIIFKTMHIGFGPEVCLAMTSGIIIFITYIAMFIIITLSFGMPASMSCKLVTLSVAANPIFNIHNNVM